MTNIFRKRIGHWKVAERIWQCGAPDLMSPSMHTASDLRMLDRSMDACLKWFAKLAADVLCHETQPNFAVQQALTGTVVDGTLKPDPHHAQRRQSLQEARDRLARGKHLQHLRDSKKRSYDDMQLKDQDKLHEYETGITKKTADALNVSRQKTFRSSR